MLKIMKNVFLLMLILVLTLGFTSCTQHTKSKKTTESKEQKIELDNTLSFDLVTTELPDGKIVADLKKQIYVNSKMVKETHDIDTLPGLGNKNVKIDEDEDGNPVDSLMKVQYNIYFKSK